MKKVLLLLLFIPSLLFNASAQISAALSNSLQTALETAAVNNNIAGTSAAVWVEGQGMWTGTAGVSHDNVAITADMRFGMGSITKNFTAALCLKLPLDVHTLLTGIYFLKLNLGSEEKAIYQKSVINR